MDNQQFRSQVEKIVAQTPLTDMHTHIYTPCFGELLLWGVDELLTYHYLTAETLRYNTMPYEKYWAMSKSARAELAFDTLFIQNSPYSESCRGVLTVLGELGLDVASRDLNAWRKYFSSMTTEQYVDKVFATANVKDCVMTNDPFDDAERKVWLNGYVADKRFHAALRLDGLLMNYLQNLDRLKGFGYDVDEQLSQKSVDEVTRFLNDWCDRMNPLYMAVSLPPEFLWPEDSIRGKLISQCVLPVCLKRNLPFAMMIGVKKLINPDLQLAGDGLGKGDMATVERLCAANPHNKFLLTMLVRENQHECAVTARKFRNLFVFGCWWFLNNPSFIEEITRMRMELLGGSMLPQHSDSRVLDQLIYKWSHSRTIIAKVLADKYADIAKAGWVVTEDEMRRDVAQLLGGAFWDFLARKF